MFLSQNTVSLEFLGTQKPLISKITPWALQVLQGPALAPGYMKTTMGTQNRQSGLGEEEVPAFPPLAGVVALGPAG